VGPVVQMRTMPNGSELPAPPLGFHTDEVLAKHGLTAKEIAESRQGVCSSMSGPNGLPFR
jgi:crotonobetainyl-CoA:carnitine CoA-transferase CaiB-like acyl-CoA transferase